jgi:hypothetical protein
MHKGTGAERRSLCVCRWPNYFFFAAFFFVAFLAVFFFLAAMTISW